MALRDRSAERPGNLGRSRFDVDPAIHLSEKQTPDQIRGAATRYLAAAYRGLVLLQVGTALVTPTDGQLYVPIEGAVTVPIAGPELP